MNTIYISFTIKKHNINVKIEDLVQKKCKNRRLQYFPKRHRNNECFGGYIPLL